jgi:multiple sugar transport system permease protein
VEFLKIKKRIRGDTLTAAIFLGPSLIGFMIFFLVPFISGFYYSLVDSPINGRFVGIKNYTALLSNTSFLKAAQNTLIFTAISVPIIMLLSLGLALLLSKKIKFRNFLRTSFIIPLAIPVASVVFVWQIIFDMNGTLNGLITAMGYHPVDWMKTDLARVVVIIVYLWKNIGYNMVLFIAGIHNIPAEYYESASIDGCSRWQKFKGITLIYLTPTTFFVFIISIINSFKVFRETYLISGQYPHDSIYMLQHYMNNMFINLDYQKLTSAAFIMALVIILLVSILFKIERKISEAIS